jgi:hypothetical protein
MIACMALGVGIPVEVVSLFFQLVQTLISVVNYVALKEDIAMTNSMLVDSGTHGVVQFLRD